jgi:hypothetical protein
VFRRFDDRGWTSSAHGPAAKTLDPWAFETTEDLITTARLVVGPDEPFDGRSADAMETYHWTYIAQRLHTLGVDAVGEDLRALPHDVVLSERLARRVSPSAGA